MMSMDKTTARPTTIMIFSLRERFLLDAATGYLHWLRVARRVRPALPGIIGYRQLASQAASACSCRRYPTGQRVARMMTARPTVAIVRNSTTTRRVRRPARCCWARPLRV